MMRKCFRCEMKYEESSLSWLKRSSSSIPYICKDCIRMLKILQRKTNEMKPKNPFQKKITDLPGPQSISIPFLQRKFGISYQEARKNINNQGE